MQINNIQRNEFVNMMQGVASHYGCILETEYDGLNTDHMRIAIRKEPYPPEVYHVVWSEVRSRTDAAVGIWAKFFNTHAHYEASRNNRRRGISMSNPNPMEITRVIFNDIATIVFWTDGTKTVVKWDPHDIYDPEKALAMAISKKALGNQGNYYNVFKKWLPEEESFTSIEYHPVTEHYGYVPGITAVWPYIVCHRDEAHLARDPRHYDCLFKTRSLQNVKAECANLENMHYSVDPLFKDEDMESISRLEALMEAARHVMVARTILNKGVSPDASN